MTRTISPIPELKPVYAAVPAEAEAEAPHGRSFPIGATVTRAGVNFCAFSRHATAMELLLFDREDDPRPARTIPLDPAANRTYHYWHAFVPSLKPRSALRLPFGRAVCPR